ncbi:MAG TPA: Mur ligase domain-containing protein [Candidatus Limnocylindrales bacterium]|nr:Mur ligase domain-containing protein [Candidatus Limnocylindrales bacterium]
MTENKPRHIHFVAICGVGMAPMAVMLRDAGYEVTGSDIAAYPPMGDMLRQAGIPVTLGFDAKNLEPRPDLVVIGNAVTRSNVEAQAVEALGIEKTSFPAALGRFFLGRGARSLVVAGTHGKTTTTGMLAHCLATAGADPGYLVGGLVRDLGKLASAGSGEYFVVEGDEYDTAYFDKGPKFLHYKPSAVILTSVEFDHADIYTDVEHVKSSFRKLAGILPSNAPLVGCVDYPHLLAAIERAGRYRFVPYGMHSPDGWEPRAIEVGPDGSRFDLYWKGRRDARLRLSLVGAMNALNATAVYALCRELGIELGAVAEGLATYKGAARRQEIVGENGGITVVDDFAHHPTAVGLTIAAIRGRFPGRRLWAVFEPRSNTSRRAIFQRAYADALAGADAVALSAVFRKDNDPLKPEEMLSTDVLIRDLGARGIPSWTEAGPDEILARLRGELREGDVVLCMSNGAFGGLPRKLLAPA